MQPWEATGIRVQPPGAVGATKYHTADTPGRKIQFDLNQEPTAVEAREATLRGPGRPLGAASDYSWRHRIQFLVHWQPQADSSPLEGADLAGSGTLQGGGRERRVGHLTFYKQPDLLPSL